MQIIDQLLAKPLSRRQFLVHVGLAVLAVMGVPRIVRSLKELGAHGTVAVSGPAFYGKSFARSAVVSSEPVQPKQKASTP